jgi:hypothetical protein
MSRRQHERDSRFGDVNEALAQGASLAFRDEDPAGSMKVIYVTWWNSGLRGHTFTRLLITAYSSLQSSSAAACRTCRRELTLTC